MQVNMLHNDAEAIRTALAAYIEDLHNTRQALRFSIWASENGDDVQDVEYKRQALPAVEDEIKRYQRFLVWWSTEVCRDDEEA